MAESLLTINYTHPAPLVRELGRYAYKLVAPSSNMG